MSIPTSLRIRAVVFVILGAAGLAVGAWPAISPPGLGVLVGWTFFLLAGTALSSASQAALALRGIVGKQVRVEIRGVPLPPPGEPPFEIVSVGALGAGIRFHLRPVSGGPRRLLILKVAQPGPASVGEDRVEIRGAAYVSWAGTRLALEPGDGTPSVALIVMSGDRAPG